MTLSNSRLAFDDCYDLLDRAMADSKGTRIRFKEYGDAAHFRLRMNQARVIDRKENKDTYEPDHKLYGRSVYDSLIFKLRREQGVIWLYILKLVAIEYDVEDLSEIEDIEADPEPEMEVDLPITPALAAEGVTGIKRRL